LQTHSIDAKTVDKSSADIIQKIDQPEIDKRKLNSDKISCSKTNIRKSIITEPEHILHGNRKQNTDNKVCSKENTKNISSLKQILTEPVSQLNKGSVIKIVRNKCVNRPPFK